MGKIEELTNALKKGRAIFNSIMQRQNGLSFAPCEVYASEDEGADAWGTIAHGDNIEYMEHLMKSEKMAGKLQLVYVDPPFFSKSKYQASVTIKSEKAGKSPVLKVGAYNDIWGGSREEYLTMLAARFLLMRELISDTGFIWVHLDWHVSHYVKLLLDEIFGYDNFINEIVWTYKSGGASGKSFARKHDVLLVYAKTEKYKFNPLKEKSYNRDMKPYNFKGVEEFRDENGWYTMVNMKDVWTIDMVGRTSGERTGYATQKPEKLIERILLACTDEGDLCADFFAGSGTLGAVAEKLGRNWLMCDEGNIAVSSQIERILDIGRPFAVVRKTEPEGTKLTGETEVGKGQIDIYEESGRLKIYGYEPDLTGLNERDREKALTYINEDPTACIRFWSVDSSYNGSTHISRRVFRVSETAQIGNKPVNVTGYDVFGNRFSWERIV